MKKVFNFLIFSTLFVCAVSFVSCEKEKNSDSQHETFEGIWQPSDCEKLVFKTDGTLLYYDVCFEGYDSKGHYILKGNTLTVVYDDSDPKGDSDVFTVKEKTADKIVLKGEDGEDTVIYITKTS